MKHSFVLVTIALFAASPSAALGQGPTILGHGNASCAAWTKDARQNSWEATVNKSWLVGYPSGHNAFSNSSYRDVSRNVDAEALFGWMDNYCADNPLSMIAEAANVLIIELRERQTRQR